MGRGERTGRERNTATGVLRGGARPDLTMTWPRLVVCVRACVVSSSFAFEAGPPSALEQERIQTAVETLLLSNLSLANEAKERERREIDARSLATHLSPSPAFDMRDLGSFFKHGMEVIVQDGFSRCFESSRAQPWNWNLYLWPLWLLGVAVRYCILFPIR